MSIYISFAVVFSVMVIADLVGNTLVVLVVVKNNSMQTPVNNLLVNLAAADIIVGIFFGIQYLITPLVNHPESLTGDILCKLVTGGVLGWVGAVSSVFSLVAIAIERYYAVMFPFSRKRKLTRKKVVQFAGLSWILALLWAGIGFFITVFDKEVNNCVHSWPNSIYASVYTVGWSVVAGFLPLGIMSLLYSRVVHRLWFTNQLRQRQANQMALIRYRRRVTKLVIAVTIVYALCWIPELTIYFLGFTGTIELTPVHFSLTSALVFLNSTINPIIYSLHSSAFRTQSRNLICCRNGRKFNRRVQPVQRIDGNNQGDTKKDITGKIGNGSENMAMK